MSDYCRLFFADEMVVNIPVSFLLDRTFSSFGKVKFPCVKSVIFMRKYRIRSGRN